jgi:hypothetical protein
MARTTAIFGSILFFLIAPVTVGGLGPWWITRWRVEPPLLGIEMLRVIAGILVATGLSVLITSFGPSAGEGASLLATASSSGLSLTPLGWED